MQQAIHLARRQVEILPALLGTQKAKPILVAQHGSLHQIHLLRQGIGLGSREDQLAIALHGAQTAAQGLFLFFAFQFQ